MVRCKFKCMSKREFEGWSGTKSPLYDYSFNVVTSGSDENKKFWEYTPSGTFNITSITDDQFKVGKEYYIDLQEAS